MIAYISDFVHTLGLLLQHYSTFAIFFVFLHLGVVAFFVRTFATISKEKDQLRIWRKEGIAGGSTCAKVLQQFVDESRHWGPRGIFVPMTDFSDRLDSFVNSRLETLYSHVNLFLVIGVAGTFFAMFRFAVSASTGELTSQNLSLRLAEGLAHAFPVGFVGLILSVVFHFIASYVEDGYRRQVNDATQHAMKVRQESGQSVFERLADSLAPLKNLQETLSGSLQPVIQGFQEQLSATSRLIEGQIEPLADAVAAFGASVQVLAEPARNLASAAHDLPEALAETARLQHDNRSLLEGTSIMVRESSGAFHAAATSMQQASTGMTELPSTLRAGFEAELQGMTRQSAELWNDAVLGLFGSLMPACDALTDSARSLDASSAALSSVPASLGEHLKGTLDGLTSAYDAQLRGLSARSSEAWDGVCNSFVNGMNESTTAFYAGVRTDTQSASTALEGAGRRITELGNQVDTHLKGIFSIIRGGFYGAPQEAPSGTC